MSDYLKSLRKYVGNAPLMAVAAGAIIHRGRQILLQRRADNDTWAIHGGGVELGESVEEAVRRELQEEIGITPLKLKLYNVFSGKDICIKYPNGDELYCVCVVFLCDEYEGEIIVDNHEVSEVRWFDVDSLPDDINAPIDRAILKDIDKVL